MLRPFTARITARTADSAQLIGVGLPVLAQAGVIRGYSPLALGKVAWILAQWGTGIAGGFAAAAVLHRDRLAIIDDLGELTFAEVDSRSNALADSLSRLGIGPGDSVAVLIRNHRGFLDASLAIAKLGADALYLNTAFAAPQLADVCRRERPALIICDQEFGPLIDRAGLSTPRVLAWVDDADEVSGPRDTLEQLIRSGDSSPRRPVQRAGRSVILTSGTTGTPKGAPRGGGNLGAAVAFLSRLPLKVGWRTHIAAPLFHTWGWAHLNLAMLLGSTCVLSRTFDPETSLRLVQRHRCESMAVIPVMLQRMLALPGSVRASYRLPELQVVAASGSALPGNLAVEWMDGFGDNLYNIYGSTEVAWVSMARPEELRRAPGTAGRPPVGTVVRLYDDAGDEVPRGQVGRIFVGNSMLFDGYSGGDGGDRARIDGLMSTGDLGRFDHEGLLFVEGRDDEMIVSGGENVFPREVEDVLAQHPAVREVAAIGVDDAEFGSRLRAFVVLAAATAPRTRHEQVADELRNHVRENLARYKVPRDIVFRTELPRNATGKILKRELERGDLDG